MIVHNIVKEIICKRINRKFIDNENIFLLQKVKTNIMQSCLPCLHQFFELLYEVILLSHHKANNKSNSKSETLAVWDK